MTPTATYAPAFDRYVEPARTRPAVWRILVGIVLIMLVYVLGTAVLMGLLWLLTAPQSDLMTWGAQLSTPTTAFDTYVILFGWFAPMAIGVFVAARVLHKRKVGTLFGRTPRVLRHFCIGAAVMFVMALLVFIPSLMIGFDGIPNVPLERWLMLLPLTLLGVAVQTGAEELLFRGYLQQQFAARFKSPIAWLVIPAALFAAVHYNPEGMGGNVWIPIAVAFVFGLMAADLTAKTGSLGAAWGMHFANNVNGIAIVSTAGTINGLSLYLTPYSASDPEITLWSFVPSLVMLTLGWAITRRLTTR